MTGKLVIRVDRSLCAGHALCAMRGPDVYEVDEEGFCCSDGKVVPQGLDDQARLGAKACPEGAITLEEQQS